MDDMLFTVPGITCGHCATAISAAVQAVPRVGRVGVDVPGKTVRVTGGDPAAVRAAITEAGYETA